VAFASFATLQTCKSLRGALRSHSSTLIVCFLRGMCAAGAGEAGRFEDEMDKDEGICPRLMFDVRFMNSSRAACLPKRRIIPHNVS